MSFSLEKSRWPMWAVVLLLVGLTWGRFHVQGIWDRGLVNDDSLQQTFYFYRAQDPNLFPQDMITSYMSLYVPPLYRKLFFTASRFWDPIDVGKSVHLLLFLLAVGSAAWVGHRSGGFLCGVATAFLVATSGLLHARLAGGLPRAFGFPLVLAFMAAVSWRRWPLAIATVFLSACFYPPVTLILFPAGLVLFRSELKALSGKRGGLAAISAGCVVLFFLLFVVAKKPDWVGPPFLLSEALAMPEWSRESGRFRELPWVQAGRPLVLEAIFKTIWQGSRFAVMAALLGSVLGFIVSRFPGKEKQGCPGELKMVAALGLVSALMFIVASVLAFRLFIPSRALEIGLPPLLWCSAAAIPAACVRVRTKSLRKAGLASLAVVGLTFMLTPFSMPNSPGYAFANRKVAELCRALGTLPADVLIAGPPRALNFVPLFSRRSVYLNRETSHPMFKTYYREIARRYGVLQRLYYATDEVQVRQLALQEKITHVVVSPGHFEEILPGIPRSFEPHNTSFQQEKKNAAGHFYFAHPRKEAIIFDNERFRVIDVTYLLRHPDPGADESSAAGLQPNR